MIRPKAELAFYEHSNETKFVHVTLVFDDCNLFSAHKGSNQSSNFDSSSCNDQQKMSAESTLQKIVFYSLRVVINILVHGMCNHT